MSASISADRSRASLTGGTDFPIAGAGAPACVVEKKIGSITSKSRSARMRSTSTEPTIPRQPMSPTCIVEMMISQVTKAKSQGTTQGTIHEPHIVTCDLYLVRPLTRLATTLDEDRFVAAL